jgi:hypothetical protein
MPYKPHDLQSLVFSAPSVPMKFPGPRPAVSSSAAGRAHSGATEPPPWHIVGARSGCNEAGRLLRA